MIVKFIEATDATEFNWGKFALMRFEAAEWVRQSAMEPFSLLAGRGWSSDHLIVFDLQTGEGSFFLPGGCAAADLKKHKVWVCPMFEPFLAWLYTQDLNDLAALPAMVNLGDVPTDMRGYRRPGAATGRGGRATGRDEGRVRLLKRSSRKVHIKSPDSFLVL